MVTANSVDFSRIMPTVDVLWRDLVAATILSELLLGIRSCLHRSKFLESQFHLSSCLSNSMDYGACEPRAMHISWKFSFWNFQQLLVKVALNNQVSLFFLFLFKILLSTYFWTAGCFLILKPLFGCLTMHVILSNMLSSCHKCIIYHVICLMSDDH